MRAMDVMTTDVITVDPDAAVQAVARLGRNMMGFAPAQPILPLDP